MADKTLIGAGSQLKMGDGADPEVFAKIAKIIRIDPITQTRATVDATTLDSTAREYTGALPDGDEFNVEAQFIGDELTHASVLTAFNANAIKNFELVPNGQSKKLVFSALVTQIGHGPFEIDSTMRMNFRLKITGAVTLAAVVP